MTLVKHFDTEPSPDCEASLHAELTGPFGKSPSDRPENADNNLTFGLFTVTMFGPTLRLRRGHCVTFIPTLRAQDVRDPGRNIEQSLIRLYFLFARLHLYFVFGPIVRLRVLVFGGSGRKFIIFDLLAVVKYTVS